MNAIGRAQLLANRSHGIVNPGLLEGLDGQVFLESREVPGPPLPEHRVLEAGLVGHVDLLRPALQAHPDQRGAGRRARGEREAMRGVQGGLDDHRLPGPQPVHPSAELDDPTDRRFGLRRVRVLRDRRDALPAGACTGRLHRQPPGLRPRSAGVTVLGGVRCSRGRSGTSSRCRRGRARRARVARPRPPPRRSAPKARGPAGGAAPSPASPGACA